MVVNDSRRGALVTVLAVVVLALGGAVDTAIAQTHGAAEDATVKWIARALNRMGEPSIAKQFWTDYMNGRVRFVSDLGSNGATDFDGKGNFLELHVDALSQVWGAERVLGKRPYGKSALLIWASTVMHEYVHMGQVRPEETPTFEDPAWQVHGQALRPLVSPYPGRTGSREEDAPFGRTDQGRVGVCRHPATAW